VGDGAYLLRLPMSATTDLSHVFPSGSAVNAAGHLELGGCDALSLAREFGTPAYIVVPGDLRRRARAVSDALTARHDDVDVLFASKAFPCTAVYRLLAAEGLACDVASGGELSLALAGVDRLLELVDGLGVAVQVDPRRIKAAGVGQIVLDSDSEIDRVSAIASARGIVQKVLLRVTPDVAGDTHAAISTGQADSKFGFSMDAARSTIDRLATIDSLALLGLHAHIGSQLFALEPFREAVRAIATLGRFPVYNLGGGLAAAYLDSEHPPSAQEWVDAIVDAVHAELGADVRLLLEPGRSLVAGSGVTLYTVQTVKRNVSTWVAVDGGMSDNLRPMLYGARYEAVIADRPLTPPDTRCHLAGKHCESGDVIVRDALLPAPGVGDIVAVPATGAYGHAMASNYNGVCRPPVVFCEDGDARLVVRRETFADLVSRDV
jgi:diaminopimelate decarboxylase